MRILVTGGAGYVGSVSVEHLLAAGHSVTVLDSLVRGHRASVPEGVSLVEGSVLDAGIVERALREDGIEAVLHCAARALVGESVADPALYYRENVGGGVALLDSLRRVGMSRIVFSSTAAVYGAPETTPVEESNTTQPINPYGDSKLAFERAMHWYGQAYGLRAVALRYFNVAGATEQRGEDHSPETHLIPNLLQAVLTGEPVTIFGDDYPTPDGTCIRDYIHVSDLAEAHATALELTAKSEPGLEVCNLGTASGFSVAEVVAAAEKVTGREVPRRMGERRPGDPPVLVASNARASELLGWTPRRGTLDEIIGSAWAWRQRHPDGYAG
jgi:UDP-glucose-4-epimerase GalE